MTAKGALAKPAALFVAGFVARAEEDDAWREEYRERVRVLAEHAAAVAAEKLLDPENASSLEDVLRSRVKNLEAAGLVRAGDYVRSGIKDLFELGLQAALAVL